MTHWLEQEQVDWAREYYGKPLSAPIGWGLAILITAVGVATAWVLW